ncbi:hypothetical protein [Ferroplasma sp.]|uniref:hypothetical protein n=1 Tax=Ferroplasma sp. TaxID=2591003 RepID=UPI00307D1459
MSYYSNDSKKKINTLSMFLLLVSIGFFIAVSLINSIYTLTAHYSILFKFGIFIVIIFDIFYAAIIFSIYRTGKFNVTDKFIFMSLILFSLIFISEILTEISTGSTIFPAIVGFIAVVFGYMYYYFKDDELLSRIMIIIGAALAYIAMAGYPLVPYIYIFGTSFMNSALWAQAFIAMEIFLILAFVFKPMQMLSDFMSSSAKPLATFIFGIGMIITGASMASFSTGVLPAALGDSLTGLLIVAGILALISGILFVILSLIEFYEQIIKPRFHFIG